MTAATLVSWPPAQALLAEAVASAQATAAVLGLPFRLAGWRGSSGIQRGIGIGSSADFQDHRLYARGDDLRHVNWSAYARTDTLVIKQHRQEACPQVDLVVDGSASALAFPDKARRFLETLFFIVASAARGGASLKVWIASDSGPCQAADPAALLSGRLPATFKPGRVGSENLRLVPLRGGSMRVLLSDLLFPGRPEDVLRPFAAAAGAVLVLVPYADEEASPPWSGPVELSDPESSGLSRQEADDRVLRQHAAAYGSHFGLWREGARRVRAGFARIGAAGSLAQSLRAEALASGAVEPA